MRHVTLRIATYHTGLGRNGPGLLLRDIRREEADILIARDAIVALAPDVILLLDVDWDLNTTALSAFSDLLANAGHPMPYHFSPMPNSGLATGLDMDGDGRLGTPDDAQGWAGFSGSSGMALLSRWPLDMASLRDHTQVLWRDLPNAQIPQRNGHPFPSAEVFAIQRLPSVAAWEVDVIADNARLTVMGYHAGPPAFGGAENRNYNRNADETNFWRYRLEGYLGAPPRAPLVILGDANLDPDNGDGNRSAIRALLGHTALQDPRPVGALPLNGETSTATANWPDGPGMMRVDYALPAASLTVLASGLIWPSSEARHAIVWLDLEWPP